MCRVGSGLSFWAPSKLYSIYALLQQATDESNENVPPGQNLSPDFIEKYNHLVLVMNHFSISLLKGVLDLQHKGLQILTKRMVWSMWSGSCDTSYESPYCATRGPHGKKRLKYTHTNPMDKIFSCSDSKLRSHDILEPN